MHIEFERSEKDLIEFNLFHIARSPTIRKQVRLTRGIMVVLTFILLAASAFGYLPINGYIVGAVFISGGMFFVYPYIYKWSVIRQVRNMLKEGSNAALLGEHHVRVSSSGIHYKMLTSTSKLKWSSVDKVLKNDKYIFIYCGATNALVIPKSAFASRRQQKEFLDYINSNVGRVPKTSS